MMALLDFVDGFKRGWRRTMGKREPAVVASPWVNSMLENMELQWRIAANKRHHRNRAALQKRGRRARLEKPKRVEVVS